MNDKSFARLEADLGYRFQDMALLLEAMHHSSYVNEQNDPRLKDNERLEFLGDAVLDLVITHILMDQFQESPEGDLSRMRATIVNESQLALVAHGLNLGECIMLGKGETQSHGEEKNSILADAFEAVVAAVYLDGGFEAAFEIIEKQFVQVIADVRRRLGEEDYKSRLQEVVQGRYKTIPRYRVIGEVGPDHDKTFHVRLTIGDVLTTSGLGKSKKAAEQAAAAVALKKLQDSPNLDD
jgi:ribonuclease III